MPSYLNPHVNYQPTQRERLDENQVKNAAGGFVYQIDKFDMVKRFLVMGTEGGTYYESERDLTKQNVDNLKSAIKEDGPHVVRMAHEVSVNGRAAKNDMALFVFALAMAHGDAETKETVKALYNRVARTGTHHLMFVNFVNGMRGWGRALKRVVGNWYTAMTDDQLAYQVVKYRNREEWTHRDVLRMCHAGENSYLYRWIVNTTSYPRTIKSKDAADRNYPATEFDERQPAIIHGFERARMLDHLKGATPWDAIRLIGKYNLTHEMIPNKFKAYPAVWEALLPNMPIHACVRNLGKMSSLGLFEPFSENVQIVLDKLTPESVKNARLHPLAALGAMKVYQRGEGVLGNLSWTPNQKIVEQLGQAFYWGFDAIEPCGKNIMLAIDVSGSMFGSMGGYPMAAYPMLTCGEIAGVLAMVTARTEQNYVMCGFDHQFSDLPITSQSTLGEVMRILRDRHFGRTDCAMPMRAALGRGWDTIDGFVIYTDNETYCGNMHPKSALEMYRDKTGRDARLAVSAMTATDTSIADGTVPYMMDFVGMSTNTPRLISQYIGGEI